MSAGQDFSRRLLFAGILLASVLGLGILGYLVLEPGWSVLDALFMTIITLTTVGYSDYEVSEPGRVFTLVLIVLGIGSFTYALATATTYIVDGHFRDAFRRKRMDKQIADLSNHCIICGLGNTGRYIVEEFQKVGQHFVVVESDADRIAELEEQKTILFVQGDATDDRVLEKAGIVRANKLIASLSADKDNLFVVLSARRLNASLHIIAKVVDVSASLAKIKLAGADHVVSPDAIGGLRLASLALRPQVVSFLDLMLREGQAVRFEEARVTAAGEVAGKTIDESQIREKSGLLVVAVRQEATGRFVYNPPSTLPLGEGDVLFVIGDPAEVGKLRKLTGDPS